MKLLVILVFAILCVVVENRYIKKRRDNGLKVEERLVNRKKEVRQWNDFISQLQKLYNTDTQKTLTGDFEGSEEGEGGYQRRADAGGEEEEDNTGTYIPSPRDVEESAEEDVHQRGADAGGEEEEVSLYPNVNPGLDSKLIRYWKVDEHDRMVQSPLNEHHSRANPGQAAAPAKHASSKKRVNSGTHYTLTGGGEGSDEGEGGYQRGAGGEKEDTAGYAERSKSRVEEEEDVDSNEEEELDGIVDSNEETGGEKEVSLYPNVNPGVDSKLISYSKVDEQDRIFRSPQNEYHSRASLGQAAAPAKPASSGKRVNTGTEYTLKGDGEGSDEGEGGYQRGAGGEEEDKAGYEEGSKSRVEEEEDVDSNEEEELDGIVDSNEETGGEKEEYTGTEYTLKGDGEGSDEGEGGYQRGAGGEEEDQAGYEERSKSTVEEEEDVDSNEEEELDGIIDSNEDEEKDEMLAFNEDEELDGW